MHALYVDVTGKRLWVDSSQVDEMMTDIGEGWEEGDGRLILAEGKKPDEQRTVMTV